MGADHGPPLARFDDRQLVLAVVIRLAGAHARLCCGLRHERHNETGDGLAASRSACATPFAETDVVGDGDRHLEVTNKPAGLPIRFVGAGHAPGDLRNSKETCARVGWAATRPTRDRTVGGAEGAEFRSDG